MNPTFKMLGSWSAYIFFNENFYSSSPLIAIASPANLEPHVRTSRATMTPTPTHMPLNIVASNANGIINPPNPATPTKAQKPPQRDQVVRRLNRNNNKPNANDARYIAVPVYTRSFLNIDKGSSIKTITAKQNHANVLTHGSI